MITQSSVVRAADFDQPWLLARAREMGEPMWLHRKLWELCAIAQVYHEQIEWKGRALGFGVGQEPLSAWLAAQGALVTATDQPAAQAGPWAATAQHAASLDPLRRLKVCPNYIFDEQVQFLPVDMNAIPGYFSGFDFTWSCGSFEHIGGFEQSYQFMIKQMECLRSGGWAAHTTEFNPEPFSPTIESPDLVLFRQSELEKLVRRLESRGHRVLPLDLTPGETPADRHVDRPPFGLPHLRLQVGSCVTTSILLIIQRGTR